MIRNRNEAFVKIWGMSANPCFKTVNSLQQFIPIEWRAILVSDGSFTRNAAILHQQNINIQLIKQEEIFSSNIMNSASGLQYEEKTTRFVWLINEEKKIAFAKSYRIINNKSKSNIFREHTPIGRHLIHSEKNAYRELNSIYLGYCEELEKYFHGQGPLWGRSYTIHLERMLTITIDEIFSPSLINKLKN
uniref:Chorismate lyase n=1 Tax=Scinaia undulata TaxID=1884664 RepID=A0A1G4NXW2_9FLOR|nr:Hypothetical protein ycf21 [Scinaia undulata]SCW23339.1 Hypothetical protein ycf21 [Scinaia undulata]